MAKNFKNEKIAILHDNTTYGKGLADQTQKALNQAGGKEALYTAYTPKEKDYSALVSRMKQAGISVIYVGGYHTEAGLIIRQAKAQGMKATLVGGDALVSNGIDPEGYVLYSYAAIQIWAEAAKKAKTTDPKKVADALKASGNWASVLGHMSFDKKGDPKGSGYVFYVWKNGSYAQM